MINYFSLWLWSKNNSCKIQKIFFISNANKSRPALDLIAETLMQPTLKNRNKGFTGGAGIDNMGTAMIQNDARGKRINGTLWQKNKGSWLRVNIEVTKTTITVSASSDVRNILAMQSPIFSTSFVRKQELQIISQLARVPCIVYVSNLVFAGQR